MRSFDRCAPLGPHQPVEAVSRAEVRAGALPVLDDPREAGLRERRPDRSCRDLVGHDGHRAIDAEGYRCSRDYDPATCNYDPHSILNRRRHAC